MFFCVLCVLCGAESLHAQPTTDVVFVGSSIFHRWSRLQTQMAPIGIQNLAFDGAVTEDWNRLIDARVLPWKPKAVVYYCGSNDIDGGDSAQAVVGRIRQFIERVTKALPGTRVVFVSVIRAPEKRDRFDVVDAVNAQMRKLAERNPGVQFVDVNPGLEHPDASPRAELFMNDQLHLRPAAYEILARMLKPVLTEALR